MSDTNIDDLKFDMEELLSQIFWLKSEILQIKNYIIDLKAITEEMKQEMERRLDI